MNPEEWNELDWYLKLTYLEGFAMEGLLRSPNEAPQSQQSAGGRTHKIETLVPIQRIPGAASWIKRDANGELVSVAPDLPVSAVT